MGEQSILCRSAWGFFHFSIILWEFFLIRFEGLRTEGVVCGTDCKAPWGKFVILSYRNKTDLALTAFWVSQIKWISSKFMVFVVGIFIFPHDSVSLLSCSGGIVIQGEFCPKNIVTSKRLILASDGLVTMATTLTTAREMMQELNYVRLCQQCTNRSLY